MGSFVIVMPKPDFDLLPRVIQSHEPILVQALGPQPPAECLDQSVIRGLAASAEVQPDMAQLRPLVQHTACGLAPVIHLYLLRQPTLTPDPGSPPLVRQSAAD